MRAQDGPAPPAHGTPAAAQPEAPKAETDPTQAICTLIETAAELENLPVAFFTRLIWKESSFRSEAVSPKGAQGIAQFMPATALERGLADPFDPEQAIPASARFLRDLRSQFGNLGLAAAAYNAGAQRVAAWIAGEGGLPWETQDYVAAITGRSPDAWLSAGPADAEPEAEPEKPMTCAALVAGLVRARAPSTGPEAPWQPWGVQVAGNFSRARALAAFASLKKRFPAVLGDAQPLVRAERSRSRGARPLFQVRIGAPSRDRADALCANLRQQGGSCVVLRN
ncbi:lytic transglycosylase domain-containing protein [Rhizobiales bacterium L72]|uniref:Lytic transglycosylase domain-containing protein n=1 Tax=Propylenella binzhouense TaxID=2555902 RepID=A0A964T7H9_9HYPH|nr:lytic transglycosylase domain-containing protein [Propylenella binzhouense]